MIVCSANELEGLSRRAARGAGLAWGLAEEAGKVARWLAVRRLPSVALVAPCLSRSNGVAYADLVPVVDGRRWAARSGDLCPMVAGAALSDLARDITPGRSVTLSSVVYPLLLSAFLGRAAKATGRSFRIQWSGMSIRCAPDDLSVDFGDETELLRERGLDVTIEATTGKAAGLKMSRQPTSIAVSVDDWAVLKALAALTYVPATDESRLRGAGPD